MEKKDPIQDLKSKRQAINANTKQCVQNRYRRARQLAISDLKKMKLLPRGPAVGKTTEQARRPSFQRHQHKSPATKMEQDIASGESLES